MFGGFAEFARYQARQSYFAVKLASIPGAYRVQIKDGQIIIHAKTRVPRVGDVTIRDVDLSDSA